MKVSLNMRILYIANKNLDRKDYLGVKYKVYGQLKAFNNIEDVQMDFFTFKSSEVILFNHKLEIKEIQEISDNYVFSSYKIYSLLHKILKDNTYDAIYYRYAIGDFCMSITLSRLTRNFKCKLIVEIPTFPYVDEISSSILKLADKVSVNRIANCINLMVSYTNVDKIFNKKVFHIDNALDKEFVLDAKENINQKPEIHHDYVNFIGVANVSKWHGYDRMVKSLAKYVKKFNNTKIKFHIVGPGKGINELRNLVSELNLHEYCIFHGTLERQEIFDLIDFNSIGVSALANHRRGLEGDKSLKNREYVAYGMPVLKAGADYELDNKFENILNVDLSEEEFDLSEVIRKYNKLCENKNKKELFQQNNQFSLENLCWDSQVGKIINAINKD